MLLPAHPAESVSGQDAAAGRIMTSPACRTAHFRANFAAWDERAGSFFLPTVMHSPPMRTDVSTATRCCADCRAEIVVSESFCNLDSCSGFDRRDGAVFHTVEGMLAAERSCLRSGHNVSVTHFRETYHWTSVISLTSTFRSLPPSQCWLPWHTSSVSCTGEEKPAATSGCFNCEETCLVPRWSSMSWGT